MKRKYKLLSLLLAAAIMLSLTAVLPAAASDYSSGSGAAAHWFYDQLSPRAKLIYAALSEQFGSGKMKDGKTSLDLAPIVGQEAIKAYVDGDGALFNDFATAKDAFDLEHPDAWYVDSSYLSFRTAADSKGYHALVGPGRGDTYYLNGAAIEDVDSMTRALNKAVDAIVKGANDLNVSGLSHEDRDARRVQYVHDQITKSISYRYEIDCTPETDNWRYIRTAYALVTHEGVCESYARSMQLILDKLNIPCVLIHGMQTSGDDPEPHMWNAVQIGGKWYAVDATWDDPIRLDAQGNIKEAETPGQDGAEHDTYLLVGQDVVGANWQPSGVVSSSEKEFSYPAIELASFNGENVYSDPIGLHVSYSAAATMEDDTPAGEFTVDFNGMGMEKAAEECGVYLLIRMYDYHPDGTCHVMKDWYYCKANDVILAGKNKYFRDTETCLKMVTAGCEYVEYALTTTPPEGYETWNEDPESKKNGLTNTNGEQGFYHGDGTDIIAETGLLFNPQSKYEAAPYVKSQYPAANIQVHIGQTYRMQVLFDDDLYAPENARDKEGKPVEWSEPNAAINGEEIRVSYTTWQPDQDYDTIQVDLAGTVNFDTKHEGCDTGRLGRHYVDSSLLEWHFSCTKSHKHVLGLCPVDGVSFDFSASTDWSDDLTLYTFQIEGLAGSRSGKRPNEWGVVMATPYCPICYRSQGIDWNLWGRPFLLDNPDDLDLSKVKVQGTGGSEKSLSELDKQMDKSGYNGKLTLTVEDISKSRPKSEEVTEALEKKKGIEESDIVSKLMYEISFTRICKMMVVEPGQSLRVSIGYPAGVTYENLKNYEIKAYHFSRNEDDEITGVDELNVTATPYGLVIICNSFSPFEIVALKPGTTGSGGKAAVPSLAVATDGNGKVTYGSKQVEAVGAAGIVPMSKDVTFTIKPNAGYVIDEVTLGGKVLAVSKNNTVTVKANEVNAAGGLLEVEFISEEVREADAKAGLKPVEPEHPAPEAPEPQPEPEPEPEPEKLPFVDVPAGAWYYENVKYVYDNGLMNGTSEDGTVFSPGAKTTRAQLVTILWRLSDSPNLSKIPFSDVPAGKYYTKAVAWAFSNEIVDGYGNGRFGPDDPITREQMALILQRYIVYRLKSAPGGASALNSFHDRYKVSSWALEAMRWACGSGIITGSADSAGRMMLLPSGTATRAEMATMLCRLCEKYGLL